MAKNRFLRPGVILTLILLMGCLKAPDYREESPLKPTDVISGMKGWLLEQKQDSTYALRILHTADWETAESFRSDSGTIYSTVSLPPVFTGKAADSGELKRMLVTEKSQSGNTTGYILEIYQNEKSAINRQQLITDYAQKSLQYDFSGNLTRYDLKGIFSESTVYSAGRLKTYQKIYKGQVNPVMEYAAMSSGKQVTGERCSDWYLITYYTDGSVTVDYLGRTCTCTDEQQQMAVRDVKGNFSFRVNCGGGGGGGSSGGSGDCPPATTQSVRNGKVFLSVRTNCEIVVPPDTTKVNKKKCDGLTPDQAALFDTTYGYIENGSCLQKALLKAVAATHRTLNICNTPTDGANASSDNNGNINFDFSTGLSMRTVMDELFHQVQFDLYGYPMAPNNVGRPNIEFESDLFRDLANNEKTAFFFASQSMQQEYSTWINTITANGTHTPTSWAEIAPNEQARQDYYHIVELYNQKSEGTLHHGTVDYNRIPTAMFNTINKADCH